MKTELHAWLRCLLLCITLAYGVWKLDKRLNVLDMTAYQINESIDAVGGNTPVSRP